MSGFVVVVAFLIKYLTRHVSFSSFFSRGQTDAAQDTYRYDREDLLGEVATDRPVVKGEIWHET